MRCKPALLLPATLLLTGCTTLRVSVGLRTRIAKLPVDAMTASLVPSAIAPGETSPLVATFTEPSGKVWLTEGKGKGKIPWKDVAVTPTLVTYKSGNLRLAADPRKSDGQTGHVVLTVPSHPTLQAAFDIPLRYDFPFSATYAGSTGTTGFNGSDGSSGSSGSAGSTDPDHPSAGGNGGNGTDGTNGSDGGDGGNGPTVNVRVTLRQGPHPLLQASVEVSGAARTRYFLIDPNGGTLTLGSEGGSGGSGGKGGRGGSGGSGGSGSPPGANGSDGHSGSDGRNGFDGRPGTVSVTYDPSVAPFLSVLRTARGSGQITFTEGAVPLLW